MAVSEMSCELESYIFVVSLGELSLGIVWIRGSPFSVFFFSILLILFGVLRVAVPHFYILDSEDSLNCSTVAIYWICLLGYVYSLSVLESDWSCLLRSRVSLDSSQMICTSYSILISLAFQSTTSWLVRTHLFWSEDSICYYYTRIISAFFV